MGKAVQKMNDLSRPVYLKSMDEEKHKPNDVLWYKNWLGQISISVMFRWLLFHVNIDSAMKILVLK